MNYSNYPFHTTFVDEISQTHLVQLLIWADQFEHFCLVDNNNYNNPSFFEKVLAVQTKPTQNIVHLADISLQKSKKWLFGHINYEYQANPSENEYFFFEPDIIFEIKNNSIEIYSFEKFNATNFFKNEISINYNKKNYTIHSNYTQQEYIDCVNKIQNHLKKGDCYELNFCIDFFVENFEDNIIATFFDLIKKSPNPFSAFYKYKNEYCLCASPERFLRKKNNIITSMPMKGTAKRDTNNSAHDLAIKENLRNNQKERSENIMVVDLVRNDLSKICKKGSVSVEELCGVYTFPQVYQMISTINGELMNNIEFKDIINACFPMGSMTGAPKIKVMELINNYEKNKRGLFSGTIGFITPEGDFDFNVVIRSMFFNYNTKKLTYFVGSGITVYSNPEHEFEECLLKSKAIVEVLQTS